MKKIPYCVRCKTEEEDTSWLFCAKSGRGANSICKAHNYSHLFCTPCLIEIGVMDKNGHFLHDANWDETIKKLEEYVSQQKEE